MSCNIQLSHRDVGISTARIIIPNSIHLVFRLIIFIILILIGLRFLIRTAPVAFIAPVATIIIITALAVIAGVDIVGIVVPDW